MKNQGDMKIKSQWFLKGFLRQSKLGKIHPTFRGIKGGRTLVNGWKCCKIHPEAFQSTQTHGKRFQVHESPLATAQRAQADTSKQVKC